MANKFFETVLRTEHFDEREWLALIEERQHLVGCWLRQLSVSTLSNFDCIDRRGEGHGIGPIKREDFSNILYLEARGIFVRKPPRSPNDDCSFYIVGYTEMGSWIITSVFVKKNSKGVETVIRATVEIAVPSHITEMVQMSYGDLWFMLGHALEDFAKQRREELEHLTAVEYRVRNEHRIVKAILTDMKVTD